ncbi:hypothetical protein BDZ89DRAFT_1192562, partial [Hymenopellis radicata]
AATETELGTGITDRLLLSLIVHCARDEDQSRALGVLDSAFTSLCEADYELPSVAAIACLTLLWQYGDRHYYANRWPEAAEWFVAGSHKLFRTNSLGPSQSYRKAALSYIEHREFAEASAFVRRCPLTRPQHTSLCS